MISVGVTSENRDKLKPSHAAFDELFDDTIAVYGYKCLSSTRFFEHFVNG